MLTNKFQLDLVIQSKILIKDFVSAEVFRRLNDSNEISNQLQDLPDFMVEEIQWMQQGGMSIEKPTDPSQNENFVPGRYPPAKKHQSANEPMAEGALSVLPDELKDRRIALRYMQYALSETLKNRPHMESLTRDFHSLAKANNY